MANCVGSERRRLRLTQAELAEIVGVSRYAVIAWERKNDLSTIRYSSLKKLVEVFGCSEDYLLGKTDERLPKEVISDER